MAGIYSFLPLMRVLMKIEQIIREEMNAIASQEILMPALQPGDAWRQTGRWDKMDDILFKLKGAGAGERDLTLGPTHEEIVTALRPRRDHSPHLCLGGVFSKYSHEYQTITPSGEDTIHVCEECRITLNKEIIGDLNGACPSATRHCAGKRQSRSATSSS